MRRYEASVMPDLAPASEDIPLAALARNKAGEVVGGAKPNVCWDAFEVPGVDDRSRRKAKALRLMASAQDFAGRNGAVIVFLKTGRTRQFYESLAMASMAYWKTGRPARSLTT